ncbi:MAG: heparan-alpha-glucosaminide N-acetyltransferase domain-containing protein [Micrococcus sp.]|nr:heparan-alpha-glucosaminide N-acetyltransferase domain-containing protein [Micrococcus sp.]
MGAERPNTVSTGEPADRTAAAEPARPPSRRAMGVDVARAVALIGMIAVHVFPADTEDGGLTWSFGIFGGRAAALFALLAGVSIAFVEKRSRGQLYGRTLRADRAALVVRGLLILLVGLLLGHLDTPILTIIPYFGVLFLLALPFYGRSSRTLLIAAAVFSVLGPVLRHLLAGHIPEQVDPEADYTLVTAAQRPDLFALDMLLTGYYPAILWMVYLCVGMVIGRQVLTSRRLALTLLGWGSALAVVAWSVSKILLGPAGGLQRLIEATPSMTGDDIAEVLAFGPDAGLMPNTTWWWLAAVSPYSETPLNLLHNLGAALAALGLALLVTRHGGKVFSPFAAIGAMTLTLYSAHCIVLMLEVLPEDRPVATLWIQVIAFMLFALMWRASMGKGPLEAVISEASDWTRHRVRGNAAVPSPDGVRPLPDATALGPLAGGRPPPDDGASLRPRKDPDGQRVRSTKPHHT